MLALGNTAIGVVDLGEPRDDSTTTRGRVLLSVPPPARRLGRSKLSTWQSSLPPATHPHRNVASLLDLRCDRAYRSRPQRERRSDLGRRAAMRPVRWAHQANVVAVRVDNDRVARTPKRVKRRLGNFVAQSDDTLKYAVYFVRVRVPKTDYGSIAFTLELAPASVVGLGQGMTVERQFKPVRHLHDDVVRSGFRAPNGRFGNLEADRSVEFNRPRHVTDDEIHLVQEGSAHVIFSSYIASRDNSPLQCPMISPSPLTTSAGHSTG